MQLQGHSVAVEYDNNQRDSQQQLQLLDVAAA
jgi:hypothetical protein